jgi:hypothetical protein
MPFYQRLLGTYSRGWESKQSLQMASADDSLIERWSTTIGGLGGAGIGIRTHQ